MQLEWKEGRRPFPSKSWRGCVICDEKVQSMCVVKHGRAFDHVARREERGRGRGWRGSRKGRSRNGSNRPNNYIDF
jgi:hypothetical protein